MNAGKAIKGHHGEYTVASKFAFKLTEDGKVAIDGDPKFIRSFSFLPSVNSHDLEPPPGNPRPPAFHVWQLQCL